jgi:hypothetical protein
LFNYSFYSHPEIGKFQSMAAPPPLRQSLFPRDPYFPSWWCLSRPKLLPELLSDVVWRIKAPGCAADGTRPLLPSCGRRWSPARSPSLTRSSRWNKSGGVCGPSVSPVMSKILRRIRFDQGCDFCLYIRDLAKLLCWNGFEESDYDSFVRLEVRIWSRHTSYC